MNREEYLLKLEEKLLLTKSKAQIITLYLDALEEIERLNNIIDELEKDSKEIVRIGKNKGYQYISNLEELLTTQEIYDYLYYKCGLYIIETLRELKEGK